MASDIATLPTAEGKNMTGIKMLLKFHRENVDFGRKFNMEGLKPQKILPGPTNIEKCVENWKFKCINNYPRRMVEACMPRIDEEEFGVPDSEISIGKSEPPDTVGV